MQKREIPYCFQKQIYKRMGVGFVFSIICLILFCNLHDEKMFLSAALVGTIILFDILYLYIKAVKGEYVRLQGPCIRIDNTGIRKRAKYIFIEIEQGTLRIPVKEAVSDIVPGDMITVYMGLRTLVYQQDNIYLINDYYVMDHKRANC